jgi:hypothetical protein
VSDGGLLGKLGLPQETLVNVVMTRDIVPRAFVCDYTLVADVLKSWLPSFKEHAGLADCKEHKVGMCEDACGMFRAACSAAAAAAAAAYSCSCCKL